MSFADAVSSSSLAALASSVIELVARWRSVIMPICIASARASLACLALASDKC